MFRRSAVGLIGRLVGSSPFHPASRPSQAQRRPSLGLEIVDGLEHRKFQDPMRTAPAGHTIIKRCQFCNRVRLFHISERWAFHSCCEGKLMREVGTMKTALQLESKLTKRMRQFDFQKMEPKSKMHKPGWKGRTRFKKK